AARRNHQIQPRAIAIASRLGRRGSPSREFLLSACHAVLQLVLQCHADYSGQGRITKGSFVKKTLKLPELDDYRRTKRIAGCRTLTPTICLAPLSRTAARA